MCDFTMLSFVIKVFDVFVYQLILGFTKTIVYKLMNWIFGDRRHKKTYDNKEIIYKMVESQKNLKIPSDCIPYCEKCGAPMTMNLRIDDTFVQDEGWYKAQENYKQFLLKHQNSRIVFLELGVGGNTPGIIKYPFWSMTKTFPSAIYVCINKGDVTCVNSIIDKAVLIDDDIKTVLENLKN